jgi:hypothetical protein
MLYVIKKYNAVDAEEKFCLASLLLLLVHQVSSALASCHHGQAGTADHGLIC